MMRSVFDRIWNFAGRRICVQALACPINSRLLKPWIGNTISFMTTNVIAFFSNRHHSIIMHIRAKRALKPKSFRKFRKMRKRY